MKAFTSSRSAFRINHTSRVPYWEPTHWIGERLLAQWYNVTHYLPSVKEADTINPSRFSGWGLRSSLKIGWKPRLIYALRGEALEDLFKQGEDTACLQLYILPFPHWEEIIFLWISRYLPLAAPSPLHTHSPAFSALSCRRARVNCSIRFSCTMVSVGFSQWGALAGEIWGKEESKTRVCIFSAPSLWLCPSPEGHSPSRCPWLVQA